MTGSLAGLIWFCLNVCGSLAQPITHSIHLSELSELTMCKVEIRVFESLLPVRVLPLSFHTLEYCGCLLNTSPLSLQLY